MCTAPLDGVPFWDSKVYFIQFVHNVLENLAKVPPNKEIKRKNLFICCIKIIVPFVFVYSLFFIIHSLLFNEIYTKSSFAKTDSKKLQHY